MSGQRRMFGSLWSVVVVHELAAFVQVSQPMISVLTAIKHYTTIPHATLIRLYHDSTFPPYCTYTSLPRLYLPTILHLHVSTTTLPSHHTAPTHVSTTTLPSHHTAPTHVSTTTLPSHHTVPTYVSTTTLPSHRTVPTHMSLPRLYPPTILCLHICLYQDSTFPPYCTYTQSFKFLPSLVHSPNHQRSSI